MRQEIEITATLIKDLPGNRRLIEKADGVRTIVQRQGRCWQDLQRNRKYEKITFVSKH
jgi:hypothetical protein